VDALKRYLETFEERFADCRFANFHANFERVAAAIADLDAAATMPR
jgi:hypothetical protein